LQIEFAGQAGEVERGRVARPVKVEIDLCLALLYLLGEAQGLQQGAEIPALELAMQLGCAVLATRGRAPVELARQCQIFAAQADRLSKNEIIQSLLDAVPIP